MPTRISEDGLIMETLRMRHRTGFALAGTCILLVLVAGALHGDGIKLKGGIEIYFSPGGGTDQALAAAIRGAEESIEVAVFTFTHGELASALIQRSMNGVKVRVILDENEARYRHSKNRDLVDGDSHIELKTYLPPKPESEFDDDDTPRMHHKFMVIDGKTVYTGSFNWTRAAEGENCENLIVLPNRQAAAAFTAEFERMWEKGKVQQKGTKSNPGRSGDSKDGGGK